MKNNLIILLSVCIGLSSQYYWNPIRFQNGKPFGKPTGNATKYPTGNPTVNPSGNPINGADYCKSISQLKIL